MAKRPRFTVCKIWDGWEWNLRAANGIVIATSVGSYETKSRAKRACQTARRAVKLAKLDIEEEC